MRSSATTGSAMPRKTSDTGQTAAMALRYWWVVARVFRVLILCQSASVAIRWLQILSF
jgi:hypothetical protein